MEEEKEKEIFVVKLASPSQIKDAFPKLCIKKGWNLGKYDADFLYDVDNTGFYIGELNGVPISCISVVKYGDKLAMVGAYVVAEEYRRKGYGLKTFKFAVTTSLNCIVNDLKNVDIVATCKLYAENHLTPMYEQWGFVKTEELIRLRITTPSIALQGLTVGAPTDQCSSVVIKPVNEVSFDKVTLYDSYVFGAPHDKYLKGLLSTQEQYAFVAIDAADSVVGLIVTRKTIKEDVSTIRPLIANTPDIARLLLKTAFETLMKVSPNDDIELYEEIGFNTNCDKVTSVLGGTFAPVNMHGMYTNGPPIEMKKGLVYFTICPDLG